MYVFFLPFFLKLLMEEASLILLVMHVSVVGSFFIFSFLLLVLMLVLVFVFV